MIWYSEQGGVELAVESELQPGGVLEDFKKLMYVKAPLKVMIHWVESHARSGEKVRREIVDSMEKYSRHVAGEQYLFIAFGRRSDDRCFSFVVPHDGTNQPICLSPVPLDRAVGV